MDHEKYWEARKFAENLLEPFLRANSLGWKWDAQALTATMSKVFSVLKARSILDADSIYKLNALDFENRNNIDRIGRKIWSFTASISGNDWDLDKFNKLNFGEWPKPKFPETKPSALPTQKKSPLESRIKNGPSSPLLEARIVRIKRQKNREELRNLFKEVMFLIKKPDLLIYEDDPFATHVFRFERLKYQKHIFDLVHFELDVQKLCEYVLRPLFFSSLLAVRSQIENRISSHQYKKYAKSIEKPFKNSGQKVRLKILPLMDLCKYCLKPLPEKAAGNSRKTRNDIGFCLGNTCKNSYNHSIKRR